MKRIYNLAALTFVLLFATACAQLGLATPQTFEDKVATAYATISGVRTSTETLLREKKISLNDAVNVQSSADIARVGVDTARTMRATDPTGADAKVNAVRAGLTAITTYLASRSR